MAILVGKSLYYFLLQAFVNAWNDACVLDSAVLMIPQNRTYLVSPLEFKGPCGSKLTVEVTKISRLNF